MIAALATIALASCEKEPLPGSTPTSTQPQSVGTNCTSVQCSALAVSTNARCKRMTTYCNGRCFQHQ